MAETIKERLKSIEKDIEHMEAGLQELRVYIMGNEEHKGLKEQIAEMRGAFSFAKFATGAGATAGGISLINLLLQFFR